MAVAPVKVLFPDSVSVPVPFFVRPPPVEVAFSRRACETVMLLLLVSNVTPPERIVALVRPPR